jgi:hypothetical protein
VLRRAIGIGALLALFGLLLYFWLGRSDSSPARGARDEQTRASEHEGSSASSPPAPEASPTRRARPSDAERSRWQALRTAIERARAERVREWTKSRSSAPGGASSDADAIGTLPADYIRAQMQAIRPLIIECYEETLRTEPGLAGRLVVEFDIAGEPDVGGIVEDSRIDESSDLARSAALSECVRETIYSLELRAPEGGGRVQVRYPFVFRPDSDAGP